MICAFFGHKDTPESVKPALEFTVKQIIERYPDTTFHVGNNGNFDRMVLSVLKSLSEEVANLSYAVILAYLPISKSAEFDGLPTIYPEGIERVPKKYAISYRNDWIVKKADMIICYITHNYGDAAKFVEKARKNGKLYVILLVCSSTNITNLKNNNCK